MKAVSVFFRKAVLAVTPWLWFHLCAPGGGEGLRLERIMGREGGGRKLPHLKESGPPLDPTYSLSPPPDRVVDLHGSQMYKHRVTKCWGGWRDQRCEFKVLKDKRGLERGGRVARENSSYRGTSLIRISPPLGSYLQSLPAS